MFGLSFKGSFLIVRRKDGSITGIVLVIGWTLFSIVMFFFALTHPESFARIGLDPTTGRRWVPTLADRLLNLSAIACSIGLGLFVTILKIRRRHSEQE